jgi:phospholipid/cholesterol/gamma-HCH transport system substrate-binding protein
MAERTRNVRVGLFLLLGVGVLIAVVAILGRKESLFKSTVQLHASFRNISGLVVGTPVRLAGMNVGAVDEITFDEDLRVRDVHVVLEVDRKYLHRIRKDSVARLGSKGLLGDVIVNITVGSAESAPMEAGGRLTTRETAGMAEVLESAQDVMANIQDISSSLGSLLGTLVTEETKRDVGAILHSAASVMEQVEHGPGLVHDVLYERRLSNDASQLVTNLREVAGTADRVALRLDRVLAGKDFNEAIANIERAAGELAGISGEVRRGKGLLHTLIYEEDQSKVVQNLTALSAAVRTVAEDLEKGRGTLGGLLKDPTLYQDLKIILGNVRRSRMLRALVRYSIAEDDLEAPPPPRVPASK